MRAPKSAIITVKTSFGRLSFDLPKDARQCVPVQPHRAPQRMSSPHTTSTGPGVPNAETRLARRIGRLMPYFGQLKGTWLLVAIAALVAASTEPMIPALLKPLLDKGFQQGQLSVWVVPASLLLLFGVRGLAGYLAQLGLTRITHDGLLRLRKSLFDRLLTAQLQLFAQQNASTLSNTVVYEVQNGAQLLVNALLSLVRNSLTTLALTAYLFYLNWRLTLIVAAMFPAVTWVMRTLSRRLHRLAKAGQSATDALAYVVEENVLAHRDVRLYGAQASQSRRFAELSADLKRLAMKSTAAGSAMTPLTQMLAAVALSAVISVALLQSAQGHSTVGGFVAFVTAMLMLLAPIRQLADVANPITRGLVALERALDLIEHTQAESGGTYRCERARGDIAMDQVEVHYDGASTPALRLAALTIQAGQTVALVGASGSGKTTLVNVLTRFVDPKAGQVTLDGQALNTWDLTSLRAQFALVSQQVVMLNGSLADNIALGLPLDRKRIQEVLAAANLTGFVDQLPQGVDTAVGHNAMQLSGGQRQRLAIARALYKDAPILILDEATSALDTESERAIQDALTHLMCGRTTLVIAHRLSTVHHADRIVVLDHGQLVESGTHAELIQHGGIYKRLYQLGLHDSTA
jgi:subfamily B ATP-binding cassette protein MsbA